MAGIQAWLEQAAATHRQAAAMAAAGGALAQRPGAGSAAAERAIRELAEQLRVTAARLAPGWLGVALDAVPASAPLGVADRVELVRIGAAYPLDDASFPVVVPLGHLAFDADARDGRVAGTLEAVLLRLLANTRAGSLLVRPVEAASGVFPRFAPLCDAGVMAPPVADRAGLQAVLSEAEQWLRTGPGERSLLVAIASWPQETEPEDLARLAALASAGAAGRLHLLVAGWPPPPLTGDAAAGPLPRATQVRLRNPYAVVGNPPGGSFAAPVPPGQTASPGLNAPVYLDRGPPADLIAQICAALAGPAADLARLGLGELIPDGPLWSDDGATGLSVVIGRRAGNAPVTLRLAETTPHCLIMGRPGAGKTALLLDVLYGLCSRYSPAQLAAYLLDFSGRASFADLVSQPSDLSLLPHARAVDVTSDRDSAVSVLRGLARTLGRDPEEPIRRRVICLIDEVDALLRGNDPTAQEARALLATLARQGGPRGVHLILASRELPPPPVATGCRVRVALPGGAAALDPANQAAAALATGTAVVNTASGLGGPAGATRAHEQLIRFPDPYADRAALASLRHRLWWASTEPQGDRLWP